MKSTKNSFLKRAADKTGVNTRFHEVYKDRLNPSLEYIASPAEATLVCHGNIGESGYIISKHKKIVALEKMIGNYAKTFHSGIYFNMYSTCVHS